MNKNETEKFNQTISEGFLELIKNRPEKPLEHFIHYLMSSLTEETKNKDKNLLNFYKKYEEFLQAEPKEATLFFKKTETNEKSFDNSCKDLDFDNISD